MRRQARRCPPPPAPIAARSCADQTALAELVVDLTAQAVPERQVDEREHSDQERNRESRHQEGAWTKITRQKRWSEYRERRDGEKDSAEALGEVVRLRPILHGSGFDNPAWFQNREVQLFEERKPRRESAHEQDDGKQRYEPNQWRRDHAAEHGDQHRHHDAGLVDLL